MLKKIIKSWFTDKLPYEHIKMAKGSDLRLYFFRWFIHPVKRRVARYYLSFLRKFFGLKIVGITGSAGKTTTKEMLASILKLAGKTVYTVANIDPIYNIPTTILKCSSKTKYLILEMGVEYPGEMDFYLWLAKPDVGVITNVFNTHTLFFGNAEGVFKEKSKLVKNLSKDSWAVLNIEDKRLKTLRKKANSRVMSFGEGGFVSADQVMFPSNKKTTFKLHIGKSEYEAETPIYGRHFVTSALAASTAAFVLGVIPEKIVEGLKTTYIEKHRMNVFNHKSGALIVDDSYNNNPSAAEATLKAFKEIADGRNKLVVIGDMLELGKLEKEEHVKLGREIADIGADFAIGVGKSSKYTVNEVKKKVGGGNALWISSQVELIPYLKRFLNSKWAILIKGSRSIGLDKVVDSL